MRIISITNQKGGCGKTTTAINLAASLAVNNRRVLLIDLDPQGHATFGLNIKPDATIYNVLSKSAHKRVALKDIIKNIDRNFDLAPSNIVLSTLEQELAGEIGRESRLWETLNDFSRHSGIPQNAGKGRYDYILIDCPPNLGILTINAIRAANEVIIPVEASRFALEGLKQLIEIMNLVSERLNHIVNFRVLVINFDSRLRHSFTMLDKIKAAFKEQMFNTIVHVNVKLKEAQNEGTHIFNHDKYCRGAKDYFSLSRDIIMQEKIPPATMMPALEKEMNKILKVQLPKLIPIAFTLAAPGAKEVYVTGDFNDWKLDEQGRMSVDNGTWKKKIDVCCGRYRYRFVIDGKWIEDPGNPNKEMNPYGEMDSLLEVEKK